MIKVKGLETIHRQALLTKYCRCLDHQWVGLSPRVDSEPSDVPIERQNRKKASGIIFRQFQSLISLGEVMRSFPFNVNRFYRRTRGGGGMEKNELPNFPIKQYNLRPDYDDANTNSAY